MNANNADKIELIVEVGWYAYENSLYLVDGPEEEKWFKAQMETVAHLVACCFVQWLGYESFATGDMLELLGIEDINKRLVSRDQFRAHIHHVLSQKIS